MEEETKGPRGRGHVKLSAIMLSYPGQKHSWDSGPSLPPHTSSFCCTSVRTIAGGQEDPCPEYIKNSDTSGRKEWTPHRKKGKGPEQAPHKRGFPNRQSTQERSTGKCKLAPGWRLGQTDQKGQNLTWKMPVPTLGAIYMHAHRGTESNSTNLGKEAWCIHMEPCQR